MSHHRERTPGVWVLGATIGADELNARDSPRVRIAASGAEDIRAAFAPLIEARERAQLKIELRRERSCHHCGAPSPGSICRYCNTVHRRTTT